MPENSQKLFPVLVLDFGESSALQYFHPVLLQKLVGEFLNIFRKAILWGIWARFFGFFSDAQSKGSKISRKISERWSWEIS